MSVSELFPIKNWFIFPFAIVSIIGTAFLMTISGRLITSICFKKIDETENKRIKQIVIELSLVTVSVFTLSSIFITAASVMEFILLMNNADSDLEDKNRIDIGLYIAGIVLYFIAETLMLLTFIKRIDSIFGETNLSLSPMINTIFVFTSCILMILGLIMGIGFVMVIDIISINTKIIMTLCFCLWSILQLILSLSLIILFVKKVNQTLNIRIKDQLSEKERYKYNPDTSDIMKTLMNDALLNVIIKHMILIPIAVISTLIFPFCARIIATRFNLIDMHSIRADLFIFDSLINSISIYLLFGFNEKQYYCCCKSLHRRCKQCQLSRIQNSAVLAAKTTNNVCMTTTV